MPVQKWIMARLRRLMPVIAMLTLLVSGVGTVVIASAHPAGAASSGDDYPWANATCVTPNPDTGTCSGSVTYDNWGYSTCPSNDADCMRLTGTLNGVTYGESDPSGEYLRNCTSAVAWWLSERNSFTMPFYDDASSWGKDAVTDGYSVNMTPAQGAVAWWQSADHVAWVQSVSSDGTQVTIEQYNADYTGTYSSTTIATDSVSGYIHFKDLSGGSGGGGSGSTFRADFQNNTGYLYDYDSSTGTNDLGDGMMSGTSPSVAHLSSGGYEEAFQTNTGYMAVVGDDGNLNTGAGMMAGTSPSITALANGGYVVAFQTNTGYLYIFGTGVNFNTYDPMLAGTSPSIASSASGAGYRVAYQASTGYLFFYDSSSGAQNQGQPMASGTSPAITSLSGGGYEMAYQDPSGNLEVYGDGKDLDVGAGMAGGTSPAIANNSTDGFRVAFQANTGYLFEYDSVSRTANLEQGMKAGTSPSITRLPGGTSYEYAFQSNTGYLVVYGSAKDLNTGAGMMGGTSPGIA